MGGSKGWLMAQTCGIVPVEKVDTFICAFGVAPRDLLTDEM